MIINLFQAEWQKLAGHRWASGLLIWLFPVGATALVIIGLLVALLSPDTVANLGLPVSRWPAQMINFWQISGNPLARLMLMGFAAVTFGGEYQWQTWKNVVPRQSRTALVLIKFVTLPGFDYTPADLSFSLLVLTGWLLGLLLVATLIFQRQDITS